MYCIKCGVQLADGQRACPLCGTRVSHPDFPQTGTPAYPQTEFESESFNRRGLLFAITALATLPILICLMMEGFLFHSITWSGYVTGGILLAYLMFVLPSWFHHPNPAVFVPVSFIGVIGFLLYICLATGGNWFLTFAFPVTGAFGILVSTVVILLHYLKRGKFYIYGGGLIALGVWTVILELQIRITFGIAFPFMWSLCPLISLFILGMMLMVIAMVKPFRASFKKFFYVG